MHITMLVIAHSAREKEMDKADATGSKEDKETRAISLRRVVAYPGQCHALSRSLGESELFITRPAGFVFQRERTMQRILCSHSALL